MIGNKQIAVKTNTAQDLVNLKAELKLNSLDAVINKLIFEFKEARK